MRGLILSAAFGAAALGGCYVSDGTGPNYSGGAYVDASAGAYATTPDLVSVSPGVQVVADYDEPVFFVDGFYWRFNDGYWYRSNNYYAGWYFYERPPVAVLRIDRPYAYSHYRPAGYVARSSVRYRRPEVISRDHRGYQAAPAYRAAPTYTAPSSRDHRTPTPVAAPVAAPAGRPAPVAAPVAAPAGRPAPAPAPADRDHRSAPPKDARDHRH